MNIGLLKCGCWVMAFRGLKKMLSVHLECPYRHCRKQMSGTLLSSTMLDWGGLPQFLIKLPSRVVARCGSAAY
jgi:hypothetical protein